MSETDKACWGPGPKAPELSKLLAVISMYRQIWANTDAQFKGQQLSAMFVWAPEAWRLMRQEYKDQGLPEPKNAPPWDQEPT